HLCTCLLAPWLVFIQGNREACTCVLATCAQTAARLTCGRSQICICVLAPWLVFIQGNRDAC
ncbi:MAG: hypothetical protein ACK55Z_00715, partial [bacterium]